MVPKQKHYVSQLLKVVEIEHVKSEDVKKKLKGCKFFQGQSCQDSMASKGQVRRDYERSSSMIQP
jgi:hypothetical protein